MKNDSLNWKYKNNMNENLSKKDDELIPIRLYLKLEPYILNDIFFWNKSSN